VYDGARPENKWPRPALHSVAPRVTILPKAEDGILIATNSFRTLYQAEPLGLADGKDGRYNALLHCIRTNYGHISAEMNFLNVPGVYQDFGVFSVLFDPSAERFRLASGRMPAAEQPFRNFSITTEGIGP
jgi:hypothetical protein